MLGKELYVLGKAVGELQGLRGFRCSIVYL